jgi:hypothetical protein
MSLTIRTSLTPDQISAAAAAAAAKNNAPTTTTPRSGFFGNLLNKVPDLLTAGINIWANDKKGAADNQSANTAAEIEKTRLMQQIEATRQAELALETAKAKQGAGVSYVIPIAVTGVLLIGGMIAYFVMKKKA